MIYTLKNNFVNVSLSSVGGELCGALANDGFDFVWSGDPKWWGAHGPLLFPLCGRIKNGEYTYKGNKYHLGCHGFLPKTEMSVVSADESTLALSLDANEKTRENYPFDFNLFVKYTLSGNTLKLEATVKNTGNEVLPFAFGTHPGFTLPMEEGKDIADYYIQFDGIDKATVYPLVNQCFVSPTGEEYSLPNGKYYLEEKELYQRSTVIFKDTKNSCTLATEGGKRAIKMTWSDDFPYFCFWKTENNGAKFICLEPWSGVPNDGDTEEEFENKPAMVRLNPGESQSYSYTISFIY